MALDAVTIAEADGDADGDGEAASAVEQAASRIREALVSGRYVSGERLQVSRVCRELSLGAMPVREALRQLEGEGLVRIVPNRGAIVRPVDRQLLADLYEVQLMLELLALRRAFGRMTLEKLDRLEGIARAHEAAVAAGDVPAALEANRRLHVALFEIAGNAHATRLFERDWELVYALRRRFGYRPGRLAVIAEEHRLLIDALRRGDLSAAETILRMHTQAGLEDVLARFEDA